MMRKDEFPIVDKLVNDSINDVLDNIRAEINALPKASFWSDENDDAVSREDVLEIINDYMK